MDRVKLLKSRDLMGANGGCCDRRRFIQNASLAGAALFMNGAMVSAQPTGLAQRPRDRDIGDIHNDVLDCLLDWLRDHGAPNTSTLPTVPVTDCYREVTGETDQRILDLVAYTANGVFEHTRASIDNGQRPIANLTRALIGRRGLRFSASRSLGTATVRLSETQKDYVKRLEAVLMAGGSPEQVASRMDRLAHHVKEAMPDDKERMPVVYGAMIGKRSYDYWNLRSGDWAAVTGRNPETAGIGSAANGDEVGAVIGGAASCLVCWTGCLACIEPGALGGAISGSLVAGIWGDD